MKKKKLLLPIMMSALCIGGGIAGATAYNNATNTPGIVQTVDTDVAASNETITTKTYQLHRMNAANNDSSSTESKDEIAAKAVDDLIEAIGEVTTESRDSIKQAKTAYEDLTYEQQKLVKNTSDLEAAIKEYNKLIRNDEDVRPISQLEHKTILTEPMEEHKGLKTTLIVLGTITGIGLFYLAYLGIRRLIKFFKKR